MSFAARKAMMASGSVDPGSYEYTYLASGSSDTRGFAVNAKGDIAECANATRSFGWLDKTGVYAWTRAGNGTTQSYEACGIDEDGNVYLASSAGNGRLHHKLSGVDGTTLFDTYYPNPVENRRIECHGDYYYLNGTGVGSYIGKFQLDGTEEWMVQYSSFTYFHGTAYDNDFCVLPNLGRVVGFHGRQNIVSTLFCADDATGETQHWVYDIGINLEETGPCRANNFNDTVILVAGGSTPDATMFCVDPSGSGSLVWAKNLNLFQAMTTHATNTDLCCDPITGDIYYAIDDGNGDGMRILRLNSSGVKQEEVTLTGGSASTFNWASRFGHKLFYVPGFGLYIGVNASTADGGAGGILRLPDLSAGTYDTDKAVIAVSTTISLSASSEVLQSSVGGARSPTAISQSLTPGGVSTNAGGYSRTHALRD